MNRALVLVLVLVSSTGVLTAQEPDPLKGADALLAAGDLARAEEMYAAYLALHPDATRARLGRATARAWSGRFDLALQDYAAVLERTPTDLAALSGSGYASLWAGRFQDGERYFEAMLTETPSSFEAKKGLAYAALWDGRRRAAVQRFEDLIAEYPEESDAHAGMAEALMASRRPEDARVAARRAEALSSRTDLRWIEREARRAPSRLEISATAGSTVFDGREGGAPLTLRSVDVAIRPSGAVTLYGQYDDGISVDTRALAITGQGVPTHRLGAAAAWGGHFVTRIGGGRRSLPGSVRHALVDLDHVVILDGVGLGAGWTGLFATGQTNEQAVRLGATLTPHAGWEVGATGHLRMVDGGDGRSAVLTLTRKFQTPVDATWGVAVGRSAVTGLGSHEVFAHVVARPWDGNGLTLTIRRRFGSGTDPFTAVAAGMALGLGRR